MRILVRTCRLLLLVLLITRAIQIWVACFALLGCYTLIAHRKLGVIQVYARQSMQRIITIETHRMARSVGDWQRIAWKRRHVARPQHRANTCLHSSPTSR